MKPAWNMGPGLLSRSGTLLKKQNKGENRNMKNTILKFYVKAQVLKNVLKNEEGQDLVEYALVVSLIAFAAIAGMGTLANDINSAFTSIGTKLTADV